MQLTPDFDETWLLPMGFSPYTPITGVSRPFSPYQYITRRYGQQQNISNSPSYIDNYNPNRATPKDSDFTTGSWKPVHLPPSPRTPHPPLALTEWQPHYVRLLDIDIKGLGMKGYM